MKDIKRIPSFVFKWTEYFVLVLCVLVLFSETTNKWVIISTKKQIYTSANTIPYNKVGLVPGCSKYLYNGALNPYFKYRMEAAAQLFHKGKIEHILVSGDNHTIANDEPTDMKNYLMQLGVPASRITLDYAGFRTFDSMVRAREIFGLNKFTVISQQFHNQRALFIANQMGMEAIGFNAKDVFISRRKIQLREYLAKVKAVLDLYVLNTQPKFLGEKIPI